MEQFEWRSCWVVTWYIFANLILRSADSGVFTSAPSCRKRTCLALGLFGSWRLDFFGMHDDAVRAWDWPKIRNVGRASAGAGEKAALNRRSASCRDVEK